MKPTALYKVELDGRAVYIGISVTPRARCLQHIYRFDLPKRTQWSVVEWFNDRSEARGAEIEAIKRFHPELNIEGPMRNAGCVEHRQSPTLSRNGRVLGRPATAWLADPEIRPKVENIYFDVRLRTDADVAEKLAAEIKAGRLPKNVTLKQCRTYLKARFAANE